MQEMCVIVKLNDPEMICREFATSERLEERRHNVTGWARGAEPWVEALAVVAEVRPTRVLDAGCVDGILARLIAAPVVRRGIHTLGGTW